MKGKIQASDFYLLRIPLLPFNTIQQFHKAANQSADSFINEIRRLYTTPLLQEALFLASIPLHQETLKWLNNHHETSLKLPLALYRYLLRMCSRCTPYGLFAGCATGSVNDSPSSFSIPDSPRIRKVTRLDMGFLSALFDELLKEPDIKQKVLFYPNDSIYKIGDSARYFEYQLKPQRQYFISAFARNEFIDDLLSAASEGATIETLTKVLTSKEIAAEEAGEFIETLINNQVLVPGLAPLLSSPENLSFISFVPTLNPLKDLLKEQTVGVAHYRQIDSLLEQRFPQLKGATNIQVDAYFPDVKARIATTTMQMLLADLEDISVLATESGHPDMKQFREQFQQRYEQQEIPLMVALDSDIGIGYGLASGSAASYTPLVDDLVMPGTVAEQSLPWNTVTQFIWEKFLQALQHQHKEITITEEDLKTLQKQPSIPLPAGFTLMGSLIANNETALDNGDFLFQLKSFSGPNALALLGRFGAGDPELAAHMRQFAKEEQSLFPDKIFAELIHLPEGRVGNVLLRSQVYEHEIHFLGKSSVEKNFQIPADDLCVSVRNNRVVLRSKRLNKEVMPRLTSAHNFVRGLAVYKFLADLQQQDAVSIRWQWGALLEQPFLPRVVYKHLILERARWYLSSEKYQQLLATKTPQEAIQYWREQYQVPDMVLLTEGDNELLICFESEMACTLLTDKLSKSSVVLYELIAPNENRLLSNKQGHYCNELIIPLKNRSFTHTPTTNPVVETAMQRSFPPGSEWLYIKIYCGFGWIDKLLTKALYPLVQQLKEEGMADRWFFIRYQDPDMHIRIRFHLTEPASQVGYVLQQAHSILQSYLDSGVVQRVQLDTYIRETERYDEKFMELSEQFFWIDSEAVVSLLSIPGSKQADRWLLALKGADSLLDGYTASERLALYQQLQQQFFDEHRGNDDLMLQLNRKFREHRRQIGLALGNGDGQTLISDAAAILAYRTRALQQAFNGRLPEQLLPHYLHMFLNRMLTANARMQELVIYHYLMKHYTSVVARGE